MIKDFSFYETVLDNIKESLYILDDKGNYLFVNSTFVNITGISRTEALNSNVYKMFEEGLYDKCVSDIVYKTKQKVTVFQDVYCKGRKEFRQIVTSTPIFDSEGNVKNIIATAKPICLINEEYYDALMNEEVGSIKVQAKPITKVTNIIAVSKAMKELLDMAEKVSSIDSTILITGESGTGKDVIAHYIHESGKRKHNKMVEVNCASLPANLLEAELFGYDKGSFTGALNSGKKGIIEEADGGTLFLDEINSLPLDLQGKLLRALETKKILRIGSTQENYVDFRLIASTNSNLKESADKGIFRKDLYYRLNVIPLTVPPLRERPEDIIPLGLHFLKYFCERYNKVKVFSKNVFNSMLEYEWPGNVRELKNFVERIIVMTSEDVMNINDIPESMLAGNIKTGNIENIKKPIFIEHIKNNIWFEHENFSLKGYLEECEREIIEEVLKMYESTYKAAKIIKISQPSMARKKKRYKIDY